MSLLKWDLVFFYLQVVRRDLRRKSCSHFFPVESPARTFFYVESPARGPLPPLRYKQSIDYPTQCTQIVFVLGVNTISQ